MRIALGIEYDGTAYNGWQRQKSGIGVQEVVEAALARVADHPLEVTCAGRTDTGVHACGQVIHFDTEAERGERGWVLGANSNLPPDVSVSWAREVSDSEFHARYTATSRSYRYVILNRFARSALSRNRAWWVHRALDETRMQLAGQALVGEHDFAAFRAAGCQAKSTSRNVLSLDVSRTGDWVLIDITANAFLQHMVRNITGVLTEIGSGDREPEWAREVLESKDRTQGGVAAPPQGLTLVSVAYPDSFGLPKGACSSLTG
jgi:tRNA pseudouridine38-40 synthase